jgi:hypothetical protein
MPIDWEAYKNHIDSAIETASTETDDALAAKIAAVTRLTGEDVKEMFPDPSDVKKLGELMAIVKSAEDRNTKINNIVSNAQSFGKVVYTLLDKLV